MRASLERSGYRDRSPLTKPRAALHPFPREHDAMNCTAVIKQDGGWWIGWIEEIPGVNSQGETREELMENLRSALGEALEYFRI